MGSVTSMRPSMRSALPKPKHERRSARYTRSRSAGSPICAAQWGAAEAPFGGPDAGRMIRQSQWAQCGARRLDLARRERVTTTTDSSGRGAAATRHAGRMARALHRPTAMDTTRPPARESPLGNGKQGADFDEDLPMDPDDVPESQG